MQVGRRGRTHATAVVVLALVLAAGCGSERTGRPAGEPEAVVREAPARTLAAGRAQLSVVSQDTFLDGTLDLATGRAEARLRSKAVPDLAGMPVRLDYLAAYLEGTPVSADPTAVAAAPAQVLGGGVQPGNPIAALDLLHGAIEVRPFGGAALRGTSTFRYELLVNADRVLAEAPAERRAVLARMLEGMRGAAIEADVWVDVEGRVRRVQLGNDLTRGTTTTDRRGFAFATTIDLFDFGAAGTGEP